MTTTNPASAHWMTVYDPDSGVPHSVICRCGATADHDGAGQPEPTTDGVTAKQNVPTGDPR